MGQIQSAINQAIGSVGQITAFGLGPVATRKIAAAEEAKAKADKETSLRGQMKTLEAEAQKQVGSNRGFDVRIKAGEIQAKTAKEIYNLSPTAENLQSYLATEKALGEVVKRKESAKRRDAKMAEKAMEEALAAREQYKDQLASLHENVKLATSQNIGTKKEV